MKQCNYTVKYINGARVFVSNKSGKVLTGAAEAACKRAEMMKDVTEMEAHIAELREECEERYAIDNAVENALILTWYEENSDLITAEQEEARNMCNRHRDARRAIPVGNPSPVTHGCNKTTAQFRAIVKKLIARRRSIRLNRARNSVSRTQTTSAVNIVCRRILGGKAMREGRKVTITFTRRILTLKACWTNLPPRANGKIGGVRCNDGKCRAWVMVKFNHCTIWILASVPSAWEQVTAKHHNTPGPKGGEAKPKSTPDTKNGVAITGWAFNLPMITRLLYALSNTETREIICNYLRPCSAQFLRLALNSMGWKYNPTRGQKQGTVEDFLQKRYTEAGILIPEEVQATNAGSVAFAMQAVNRCMIYAMKHSTSKVIAGKEIRSELARLCLLILHSFQAGK